MVLSNALYFKGMWTTQFCKEFTSLQSFFVQDDKTVEMPMMHVKSHFKVIELADLNFKTGIYCLFIF